MKHFIFKAIYVMVVALVAQVSAKAQVVNQNISTSDFKACKEYLQANPADTIVSESEIPEGKICRKVYLRQDGCIVAQNDTVIYKAVVKKSFVTPKSVKKDKEKVVLCDGEKHDTLYFVSTNDVSDVYKRKALRGEAISVDPHHKDMTGWLRHRVSVSALGGGLIVGQRFAPMATARLTYEMCYTMVELEGTYSTMKYTQSADAKGIYSTFSAVGNFGWKFWQDNMYRSYLAVVAHAGYGYQKTDSDEAMAHSDNYGLVFGGSVRGSWGVSKHLRLIGEAGYMVYPKVEHNQAQDLSHGGAFARVGIGYTW